MRKIDKSSKNILSKEYKEWVDAVEKAGKKHPKSTGYAKYYDDVAMNLLYCQDNVCAYTEICLCNGVFTKKENWADDKFKAPAGYRKKDHFGELDHFDPSLKTNKYWLWENLFMVHASVNGNKLDKEVYDYLKPDSEDYSPEKFFDYNDITHMFVPNTDIKEQTVIDEIQYMIDEVLYLNHGAVRRARIEYITDIEDRRKNGLVEKAIDQFFTATEWTLNGKPDNP